MSQGRRLLAVLASLLLLTVATTAGATQTVIDAFESASSPSPWVFSNGPEFPGAAGSLTSGPGASGKGAALAYDFTGGVEEPLPELLPEELSLPLPDPASSFSDPVLLRGSGATGSRPSGPVLGRS